MKLHAALSPPEMRPFHDTLEKCTSFFLRTHLQF